MSNTTYAPGTSVKTKETSFGPIYKLGINVEKFTAFLKEHANDRGYVNLDIVERKEVSDDGQTHSVKLDDWKPAQQGGSQRKPAARGAAPQKKSAPVQRKPQSSEYSPEVEPDDVPF